MEGHAVRGPLHRQWDLERKHAKQAEARLSQQLQRLERTYLGHLRLLAWEQRQLQKQLQRLQQGIHFLKAAGKGKCPSYSGNRVQQRPGGAPVRPQQGGDLRAPRATGARALATNTAQEARGGCPRASSRHDGLGGPVRSEEQSPPQSHVTSHLTGETPPNQAVAPGSTAPGPEASPAGDHGRALGEARPEATGLQPGLSAGEHTSPGTPSFREVLARAANAHYLRHRVPPEAERLLSMGEIFGHGGPGTPRRAPGGHLSDPPVPSE
ncbi:coiled-coil domain-containing protein 190 [Eptesicus fuscus]|uniref:coiled-coil domain-containing protein 190 n=1 Tax=Eptesicus fuscus TaxID=29078 RepID=UPI002403D930|nr:coiled-coil domain-containing protein 190 [Eptesicus fuscus]